LSQKIKQNKERSIPLRKKIFTKSNFTKVFLPSLALLLIILSPVVFEAFKTRHQQTNDVVTAPPDDWIGDIFAPGGDYDPDNETQDGLMDDFINGVNDTDRVLFIVTPTDHFFYWRLEAYDNYTTDDWLKDDTKYVYTDAYTPPTTADGEFSVTSNITYFGGSFVRSFPAPYHYQEKEQFSTSYSFSPISDWNSGETFLEIDNYDSISFNALFENSIGNSTLNYNVAYTLQDNNYIAENTLGFTELSSLINLNPELSDRYLQLPNNYATLAPYTNQIASDLSDTSGSVYDQVYRDMAWLNLNNDYDIDILTGDSTASPDEGEDHVEWFLNRHLGTAAHFAASLAIFCRLQNIPSRLVFGFSYGEQLGNEFIIRTEHVHTWVEVFIPINGLTGYWVAFDPSPLIPGFRDSYGENTIGFETALYCSNEFFLEPQHMLRNSFYPYFVPNPLSDAWYEDPYNPSTWYGPYVNRTDTFTLYAFLASGTDSDVFIYLTTGILGNLVPIEGELITFIDTTNGSIIGTSYTNASGFATYDYAFPATSTSGLHKIAADWLGIQAQTYDLRYIPLSNVESGAIVTGTVNIDSYLPEEMTTIILDLNSIFRKYISKNINFNYIELYDIQLAEVFLQSFLPKIIFLNRSN